MSTVAASSSLITILFVYSPHENPQTGGPQMLARFLRRIDRSRFRPVILTQCLDEWVKDMRISGQSEIVVLCTPSTINVFGGGLLRGGLRLIVSRITALTCYIFQGVKALRKIRPALVWCINLRALLTVGVAARVIGLPVVWQIGLGVPSQGIHRLINDVALNLSTAIFIESETQLRRLFTAKQMNTHSGKFMILPKGIELERFDRVLQSSFPNVIPDIPPGSYVIGTVGTLTPRKGIDVLLKAVAYLGETQQPIHVVAVGGVPIQFEQYFKNLSRLGCELNLRDRVHFVGFRKDVERWLAGFDIFVLPSLSEGVSGALREAMAMALPVIATDVGGTSDFVQNEINGLLIKPADPITLADAINRLRSDPGLATELGRRARETACRLWSISAHVARYECAFEVLLERKQPGVTLKQRLRMRLLKSNLANTEGRI